MKIFRERFDRGHRRRWTEKSQNNLKEYFVNVGCRLGTNGEIFIERWNVLKTEG
jgi:hypothetical protein